MRMTVFPNQKKEKKKPRKKIHSGFLVNLHPQIVYPVVAKYLIGKHVKQFSCGKFFGKFKKKEVKYSRIFYAVRKFCFICVYSYV